MVAHTSETATGDLRKVPYGARLAVCTETTALTLSEDGAPAWAPARIDDVSRAAQNDSLPPDATFTVASSNGAVALKDERGQLHSPKLAELVVCVGGCDSLVGVRVPAGAVGVVACHRGEKDTPLAVRWDSAPRSVIAAAAALCGDAGASDDAAQSAARVLASKIVSSQNELCLLYTSPSPRDKRQSRMPSSA